MGNTIEKAEEILKAINVNVKIRNKGESTPNADLAYYLIDNYENMVNALDLD